MQISTKFTIAIHILAAVEYFGKDQKVTSDLLSSSIGANPVIIRGLMSDMKKAGLIDIKRGPGGITLSRPLDEISFYDVYEAVEKSKDELFHFHENPDHGETAVRAGPAVRFGSAAGTFHDIFLPKM